MSFFCCTFAAAKVFRCFRKVWKNCLWLNLNARLLVHMKRCFLSYFLVFTCTLLIFACTCCNKQKDPKPVQVRASLFHNPDSLLFYAEKAYLEDDAYGLYVTGAAAFLRENNPDFPDSCTTVPLDEARIMLLRAAELGNEDAQTLIHCLELDADWELQY